MDTVHAVPAPSVDSDEALRLLLEKARYVFDTNEFAQLTGRSSNIHAARIALGRLSDRKRVVAVHRRPSIWVIVPPEYSHYGAPPVSWWLHDCLTRLVPCYYVALLAAAKHWGSSHYALQVEQVIVREQRLPMTAGRQKVVFFTKSEIDRTPIVEVTGQKAPLRVSTREATLLDLMRHQDKVGGIEAIARIAKDFSPHLSTDQMLLALDAMGQVAVAQRLGFLFDRLALTQMAELVAQWLAPRKLVRRPLTESVDQAHTPEYDARWFLKYSNNQLGILDEIR
jgi:AbiEi antitoxin C-terminal domain